MHFLRRHQFLLCFLAVLVFACVMVVRQFEANQSAHIQRREDFIFLIQHGNSESERERADHLYQVLVQDLPAQSEKSLADDLLRTAMLVNTNAPVNPDDLLLKYQISLKKTLEERSQQRLGAFLKQAEDK